MIVSHSAVPAIAGAASTNVEESHPKVALFVEPEIIAAMMSGDLF